MDYLVLFVVLVLCLSSTSSLPPAHSKKYRTDYEYNQRTDSFYKLHTETKSSWKASIVCQAEGAQLMIPESLEDIKQLHGLFKRHPELEDFVWVGLDGKQHESAEEEYPIYYLGQDDDSLIKVDPSICNVVNRNGEVVTYRCILPLPFICKVRASDAPYNSHCDVYANDYQYNSTVGSCYRIPRMVATWNEAYAECEAEQAHLVVLNSETERAVVQDLIKATTPVDGAQAFFFFFAGFRASEPHGNETVVFKTIFNQTLEEAGFAEWSPGEPNNALHNEYCGTIFLNDGKLNDVYCAHYYAFICEKEKPKDE